MQNTPEQPVPSQPPHVETQASKIQALNCQAFEQAAWHYARFDSKREVSPQELAGLGLFLESLTTTQESASLLPPKILDAGCGYGKNLKFFKSAGLNAQGLEQSPALAEIATGLGLDVRTQNLLFLSDNSQWDGIWASNVLEFFSPGTCIRILQSFFKALKPGAVLYVSILAATEIREPLSLPFHRWLGAPVLLGPDQNPSVTLYVWQENDFLSLLRQSGLAVLKRSQSAATYQPDLNTLAFVAKKQLG